MANVTGNVKSRKKGKRKKGVSTSRSETLDIPLEGVLKIVPIPNTRGKKEKLTCKWNLHCSHCLLTFSARPTPKNSRYVVNHQCEANGHQRKQFIVGGVARNCNVC